MLYSSLTCYGVGQNFNEKNNNGGTFANNYGNILIKLGVLLVTSWKLKTEFPDEIFSKKISENFDNFDTADKRSRANNFQNFPEVNNDKIEVIGSLRPMNLLYFTDNCEETCCQIQFLLNNTLYYGTLPSFMDIESLKIWLLKRRGWVIVINNFDLYKDNIRKEICLFIQTGKLSITNEAPAIDHKINFIIILGSSCIDVKKSKNGFKFLKLKFDNVFLNKIDLAIDLSSYNHNQKILDRKIENYEIDQIICQFTDFSKTGNSNNDYEILKQNQNFSNRHPNQPANINQTLKKLPNKSVCPPNDKNSSASQESTYSFFKENCYEFSTAKKRNKIKEEGLI